MIIAIGVARPAPGRREELLQACRRVAEASQHDEGCVEYGFHISLENPDAITSVEIWAYQSALEAHMDHEHTREFLSTVAGLTDGEPQMRLLQADPAS